MPRSDALRKEIKRNERMKIYRAKIRRFLGEYEVSRRRRRRRRRQRKGGSINVEVLTFSRIADARSRACSTFRLFFSLWPKSLYSRKMYAARRIRCSAAAYVRVPLTCFCCFGPRGSVRRFWNKHLLTVCSDSIDDFFRDACIFRFAARMRTYVILGIIPFFPDT